MGLPGPRPPPGRPPRTSPPPQPRCVRCSHTGQRPGGRRGAEEAAAQAERSPSPNQGLHFSPSTKESVGSEARRRVRVQPRGSPHSHGCSEGDPGPAATATPAPRAADAALGLGSPMPWICGPAALLALRPLPSPVGPEGSASPRGGSQCLGPGHSRESPQPSSPRHLQRACSAPRGWSFRLHSRAPGPGSPGPDTCPLSRGGPVASWSPRPAPPWLCVHRPESGAQAPVSVPRQVALLLLLSLSTRPVH